MNELHFRGRFMLGRLLVLALVLMAAASAAAGTVTHRVVAGPGIGAAGAPGVYEYAQAPAISSTGKIAFNGSVLYGSAGVWLDDHETKTLYIYQNMASSEQGLVWGFDSGWPNVEGLGHIVVRHGLMAPDAGSDSGNGIFYTNPDGSVHTLVLDGQATPIADTYFHPTYGNANGIVLSDDFGHAVFTSTLTGNVDATNDNALWMYDGASFILLERDGDAAPGGGNYSPLLNIYTHVPVGPGVQQVVVGGSGDVLFKAYVVLDPVNAPYGLRSALFIRHASNGITERVAVEQQSGLAGMGGNEVINSIYFGSVNRDGKFAFHATVKDTSTNDVTGITWVGSGSSSLSLLHRDPKSGDAGYAIGADRLDDYGEVASDAVFYDGNGSSVETLLRVHANGTIEPLVAVGDPAPGTSAGETFANFYGVYTNSVGQFAVWAGLDGSDPATDYGIWAGSGPGDLQLVVRRGDVIDGQPAMPDIPTAYVYKFPDSIHFLSDQGDIVWTTLRTYTDPNYPNDPIQDTAVVVSNFGPPPPPPPQLVGLEAVQVIQNWRGEVPLYLGKPTLIRAHLRSEVTRNIPLVLRVFDGANMELPYSPLPVEAPGGLFTVRPNGDMMRGSLAGSANWTLPPDSLGVARTLKVENLTGSLDCMETSGLAPDDCTLEILPQPPQVPQLRIVALDWFDPKAGQVRVVDRASRQALVERLVSQYPVAKVDWDDRQTTWPEIEPLLKNVLPYVRRLRALDNCSALTACQRMYYGVLRRHSLDGLGYVDGFAASGFMHPDPNAEGRQTHSHEIGHNLARQHSVAGPPTFPLTPKGKKRGACGSTAPATAPDYPYFNTVEGFVGVRPTLGPMTLSADDLVYGYDSLQHRVVDPFRFFDLMGYCSAPVIDMWPSIETYTQIAAKLTERYGTSLAPRAATAPQAYVLVSGTLAADGQSLSSLTIDRAVLDAAPDVSPGGSWEARLLDSGSNPITSAAFTPDHVDGRGDETDSSSFFVALYDTASVAAVEIRDDQSNLVGSVAASAHAPTVTVQSPNGGETLSTSEVTVNWSSDDADGQSLRHAVQFSADGGATWTTMALDVADQSATFPRNVFPATTQGRFRVIASDGFLQAQDDSDASFTVSNSGPTVHISSPLDGTLFLTGQNLNLLASAYDTDDGVLDGSQIAWSSNVDGALGTGTQLQVAAASLAPGPHVLTATATDSGTATGTDTVNVIVATERPTTLVDVALDLTVDDRPKAAFLAHPVDLVVTNAGPDAVGDLQASVAFVPSPVVGASGNSGMIAAYMAPAGWSCTLGTLTASCTAPTLDALSEATVTFEVVVDQESFVEGTASFTSSATDSVGANNTATLQYVVGADDIFGNGFD